MNAFFDLRKLLESAPARASRPDAPVAAVHAAVPGRLRIKVRRLYRAEALKRKIEQEVAALRGVERVQANTLTSSVLVLFDSARPAAEIVAAVAAAAGTEATTVDSSQPLVFASPPERAAYASAPEARPKPKRGRAAPGAAAATGPRVHWHRLETGDVLGKVESGRKGLPEAVARERLARVGRNTLPEPPKRSELEILLEQLKNVPVALLGASAVVSAMTGGIADAIVIMGVVAINAGIGFTTERQAERTIDLLKAGTKRHALVLRDGVPSHADPEEVVPGDVFVLTPGSYVAADARILDARDLAIDESALTGESLPVSKRPERIAAADVPLADRTNMAYLGTFVTGGSGAAVVVGTGSNTEIGAIQAMVSETKPPDTPMERQLERLGNQLVWMAGGICVAMFGVGLLRGYGLLPMLKSAISLAVAAVPEGLPTVATTTLALGIRNMRRHNVLVRQLDAVETLGSVQVICLDKTGTLTVNRMAVLALCAGFERLDVRDHVIQGSKGRVDPLADDTLTRLLQLAVLNSETKITDDGAGQQMLNGSATENALVRLAIDCGVSPGALRAQYPLEKLEYRAEGRNFMQTLHRTADGEYLLAIKGSPQEVLDLCRWIVDQGHIRELTEAERLAILQQNERMAGEALRVLGFAYARGEAGFATGERELVWVGLAGMADPIREGVKPLIGQFHDAGIKTVMITGDQSATAYAIGRELELSGDGKLEILDSTHIDEIEPELLSALAQKVEIFSRVSPAHKLGIVQGLQRAGRVVAMTGDGVNDGPALRAADIGVAMGSSGTDVARSVSDVVLEDDELQTMIIAVSEGRRIYQNIRKSLHFLLSTNLSEIEVMVSSIALGLGEPLNTMQLLWTNLVTDVFPALALAVEPAEPDVLKRPPRDPEEPIVTGRDLRRYGLESLAITAGTMGAYAFGIGRYGIGPQASTMAFSTLTLAQLAHAYSCRSDTHGFFTGERMPRNLRLDVALAATAALQVGTLFVPPLRGLLRMAPIGIADLGVVALGAGLPYIVNEGVKAMRSREQPPARPKDAIPMQG